MIMLVGHIIIILGSSHLTHLCFAQTALFLVLVPVFQSHSVAGLLTDDEKSLYFGLEEEGKYFLYTSIFDGIFPGQQADQADRREKSLLNTFPFNLGNDEHHQHHHQEHHHHHQGQSEVRDNAKTQHNGLFPFKSAGTNTSEEAISIEDFIVETGEVEEEVDTTEISGAAIGQGQVQGSVDFNTIGAASTEDEDVALGRKCIDKV